MTFDHPKNKCFLSQLSSAWRNKSAKYSNFSKVTLCWFSILIAYQCCQCDARLCLSCLLSLCRCWRRRAWWGSAAAPPLVCAAGWWCWRDEGAPLSSAAGWRSSSPAALSLQGGLDSRPVSQRGCHAPAVSETASGRTTWGAPHSDCRTEEPPEAGGDCKLFPRGDCIVVANNIMTWKPVFKITEHSFPTLFCNLWLYSFIEGIVMFVCQKHALNLIKETLHARVYFVHRAQTKHMHRDIKY